MDEGERGRRRGSQGGKEGRRGGSQSGGGRQGIWEGG